MLGEMLCAGFATQNFSWIGSPAATELETVSLCSGRLPQDCVDNALHMQLVPCIAQPAVWVTETG